MSNTTMNSGGGHKKTLENEHDKIGGNESKKTKILFMTKCKKKDGIKIR